MAAYLGDDATALIDANDILEVVSIAVNRPREDVDVSTINSSARKTKAGQAEVSIDMTVYWDTGDTTGQELIRTAYENKTTVNLVIHPRGTGSSLPEWTMTAEVGDASHGQIQFNSGIQDTFRFTNPSGDYAEGTQAP